MSAPPADDLEKRLRALQSYLRSAAHGTDAFDADVAALDAAIALRHKLEEAERWAALRAQDIITLGQQVGRAQAQRDALAKALGPLVDQFRAYRESDMSHYDAANILVRYPLWDEAERALAAARAQAVGE